MKVRILFAGILGVAMLASAIAARTAPQANPVVTEGVINAPVAEVWRLWTTKEGIESWMVAKTDIDLRPGGLWRTSYNKDSTLDDDSSIHHMVLAFDPGRMFVSRTIKAPKNFPFPNAILKPWTIVYFEAAGESRTKVTVHMLGFGDDDESRRMRPFFESGNKSTLDSLMKKLK